MLKLSERQCLVANVAEARDRREALFLSGLSQVVAVEISTVSVVDRDGELGGRALSLAELYFLTLMSQKRKLPNGKMRQMSSQKV